MTIKTKNIFTVNIYVVGDKCIDKFATIKNIAQNSFNFISKTILQSYQTCNVYCGSASCSHTVYFHDITPNDSIIDLSVLVFDPYVLNIAVFCYDDQIESKMNIPSWVNQLSNFQVDNGSIVATYLVSNDPSNKLISYADSQVIEHVDNDKGDKIYDKIKTDIETFANNIYGKYYLRYYFGNYCTYL